MPGSSLWLLPPRSHPLNALLTTLIDQTSSHFRSTHRFLPHVTLTSDVNATRYGSDPQTWLDSLSFSSTNSVGVDFQKLASDNVFVRKLYVKCASTEGLMYLAAVCRTQVEGFGDGEKARAWAEENYNPHLSLLYHDCPVIDAKDLSEVESLADKLGVSVTGKGDSGGWRGGQVVLVPTDKPIDQWTPIAIRTL